MMGKCVIFFVGFLIAASTGLPANKKDEVESVEPISTYGDQPIVDTGSFGGWENPFSTSFGGLFDNLEGLMDRMRNQIASLLNRFPISSRSNSTDVLSPFPGLDSFPGIGNIDLSKGNTTSITKVIDGRTVVINETEYKNEDDFGGTFFKVRVIDVKPENDESTTTENIKDANKEKEPIADSLENEISKSKEVSPDFNQINHSLEFEALPQSFVTNGPDYENKSTYKETRTESRLNQYPKNGMISSLETFTKVKRLDDNKDYENKLENFDEDFNPEWNGIEPVESIETNAIDEKEFFNSKHEISDLTGDTYVNVLAARNGMTPNPDAEVFDVFDPK